MLYTCITFNDLMKKSLLFVTNVNREFAENDHSSKFTDSLIKSSRLVTRNISRSFYSIDTAERLSFLQNAHTLLVESEFFLRMICESNTVCDKTYLVDSCVELRSLVSDTIEKYSNKTTLRQRSI